MAYQFYVTVQGAKQGKFNDESAAAEPKGVKGRIVGVAFDYSVDSPRDPVTGLPTGKRVHHPVTFVKQWGAATPQFFQAAVTNEALTSVIFEFMNVTDIGKPQVFHRVTLTNAAISGIEQVIDHDDEDTHDARPLEKISLVFQKIEIESVDGKTVARDDWVSP